MGASSPEPATALDLWTHRVRQSGSASAFRFKQDGAWRDLSWTEADIAAREIGAGLVALGLGVADKVCILSQTRLEWVLTDLGCVLAGLVSVPIYPSSTPATCAYIVGDAEARAIVVEDAAQLEKVLPLLGTGKVTAIHLGGDAVLDRPDDRGRSRIPFAEVLAAASPEARAAIHSLDSLRAAGRDHLAKHPQALAERTAASTSATTFTVIYTSGTTGVPKGAVLSHGNLIASVTSACRALTLGEADLQYLWLPLAHVLGREMVWAPFVVGAPMVFTEGLLRIKDNLLEIRPTFMAAVPRILEKFYVGVNHALGQGSAFKRGLVKWALGVGRARVARTRAGAAPGAWLGFQYGLADRLVFAKLRRKLGLDRCRFLLSGGAPLAPEIAEFFHGVGLLVLEGYGLTETFAACFVNRVEKFRIGTVGPAIDVVEHRFAEDGEILLRGPSVFQGYYRNAAATAEVLDPEGWFHTGDIGQLEDGCLKITDRKKDLIVTATGKKIAPQELENGIKARCPLVGQAYVHGDRRPYCVALLTLSEDAVRAHGAGDPAKAAAAPAVAAALDEAVAALNSDKPHYGRIQRFAVLPADFSEATEELTPSLKVRRHVVAKKYSTVIDGLYAREA
jgi:long-chain acyl-CoA synthetase